MTSIFWLVIIFVTSINDDKDAKLSGDIFFVTFDVIAKNGDNFEKISKQKLA